MTIVARNGNLLKDVRSESNTWRMTRGNVCVLEVDVDGSDDASE